MLQPSLKNICLQLHELIALGEGHNDNLDSLYIEGRFTEANKVHLANFAALLSSLDRQVVRLKIDEEEVNPENFDQEVSYNPARWDITLEKSSLLELCGYDSRKTKFFEYLFFSTNFLYDKKVDFLGTNKPFGSGLLNKEGRIRIQVYGLDHSVGGEHLFIIPVDEPDRIGRVEQEFKIPSEEKIKNSIRILSSNATRISPSSYRLSWGCHENSHYNRIKVAYLQTLLTCFCSTYYSESELVLEGLKKIHLSVLGIEFDNSIDEKIKIAEEVAAWIFSDDDYETKKTLFSDRLTLDVREAQNFLLVQSNLLQNALSQAKSKYKYVIAERNDDYRKELKDLYSDVKVFTDSLANACENLTKGLITDVLSLGFLFSLTMFARVALGRAELLHSQQIGFLFKMIAVYLVIAFVFRFWNAKKSLDFAENQFDEWSKKLHNHISTNEISFIKAKLTVDPIRHFESVSAVVGGLHFLLAFGVFEYRLFI